MQGIELIYMDGTTEAFDQVLGIEAGAPALFRDERQRYTDYAMPHTLDEFPRVLYVVERAGDVQPRLVRDVREIRAL